MLMLLQSLFIVNFCTTSLLCAVLEWLVLKYVISTVLVEFISHCFICLSSFCVMIERHHTVIYLYMCLFYIPLYIRMVYIYFLSTSTLIDLNSFYKHLRLCKISLCSKFLHRVMTILWQNKELKWFGCVTFTSVLLRDFMCFILQNLNFKSRNSENRISKNRKVKNRNSKKEILRKKNVSQKMHFFGFVNIECVKWSLLKCLHV